MRLKWTEEPVLRKLFLPQHDSQLTSSNATYVNILNARQYYERNYTLEDIPEERKQNSKLIYSIIFFFCKNKIHLKVSHCY